MFYIHFLDDQNPRPIILVSHDLFIIIREVFNKGLPKGLGEMDNKGTIVGKWLL